MEGPLLGGWSSIQAALRAHLRTPWRPSRRVVASASLLLVLTVSEVLGKNSTGPMTDLVLSLGLVVALTLIARGWGIYPGHLTALASKYLAFEAGMDLRGDPPVERREPRLLALGGRALFVALVLAVAGHAHLPTGFRSLVLSASPTVYFLGFSLFALAIVWILVEQVLLYRSLALWLHKRLDGWGRPRALGLFAFFWHTLLISLAVTRLPAWLPLALIGGGTTLSFGIVFLGPDWQLLLNWWRRPGGQYLGVAAADLAWKISWLSGGSLALLVLLTAGEELGGPANSASVGEFLAWCAVTVYARLLFVPATLAYHRFFRNPAVAVPPRVVVLGELSCARRDVQRALGAAGFRVAFGDRAHASTDVPLRLVEPVFGGPGRWAVAASLEELHSPKLHARLRRRATLRRRRQFLHAQHRMSRAALRGAHGEPGGYWLVPHLWFFLRMNLDEDERREPEAAPERLGPSYADWMPLEARAELYGVLLGASIDHIYVEYGLPGRSIRAVFRTLFESHDIFAGCRRAEEQHFLGIPGLRVLIQDLEVDREPLHDGFHEPDYRSLARARVLLLLREEGGAGGEDAPRREDHGRHLSSPSAPTLAF